MSRDTRFPSTRRDLPIFHLRGLLRDASMPPRQQSFSLKSFLVRDFSVPRVTTRPRRYHSFTPCFFSIPFSLSLLAPLPSTSYYQRFKCLFSFATLANNSIAFLFRSLQLFSRSVLELRLSKTEQFIPVYRSSRSVEESPNQFASDQSPPFQRPTFAGSPFSFSLL